jgi:energy-coupling factor transporter transmembrane protein EcfT
MLVNALRTAENLSRALEARAFGAPGRGRTVRRQLHLKPSDGLLLTLMLILSLGLMTARLVWGWG